MNYHSDKITKRLSQPAMPRKALAKSASIAASIVAALAFHDAAGAIFTTIDFPNALATEINGVTPSGPVTIVGDYIDPTGTERGYLFRDGIFASIEFPGSLFNQAFAINTNGVIVGDYAAPTSIGNGNTQHGYVLVSGTFSSFDYPGAAFTTARGINSHGDIVGSYYMTSGNANISYLPTGNGGHGFVLRGGVYSSIDFPGAVLTEVWRITDSSVILGRYQSPADGKYHLFLFNNGAFSTVPDVPASIETAPADVSFAALDEAGNVVGDFADRTPIMQRFKFGKSSGNLRGFVLSGGVYTAIDFPGVNITAAWGIHSSGIIVGPYVDANNVIHGYIRTP